MAGLRSEFPLTRFLSKLLDYSDAQIAEACPKRAAKHYGISPDHASGYIGQERARRGMPV